jgi:hypothetical protein
LATIAISPELFASLKLAAPMALDRAAAILEIATPIAEAIPVLGLPVKSAFDATVKILKYAGVGC